MNFETFAGLVSSLHEKIEADTTFLDGLPAQVSEFVATNALSESLYVQRDLLCAAAFGERWPDVQWFLYDWRPGFAIHVAVDTLEPREYPIHNLADYLAYAKKELF